MGVKLLSTLKMGKTILMTPIVLEICFQQTAIFQHIPESFNKTITHWFQEVPLRSLMYSLSNSLTVFKFSQGFSSSFSKTVSQVPSQGFKFVQTVSQVSSRSLRSLTRFLKVPQGLSGSLKMSPGHHGLKKHHIKPQGITSQQDGMCTILQTLWHDIYVFQYITNTLYHKHFGMIDIYIYSHCTTNTLYHKHFGMIYVFTLYILPKIGSYFGRSFKFSRKFRVVL